MSDERVSLEKQLMLRKTYVKSLSFESTSAPEAFASDMVSETLLNVRAGSRALDADHFDVDLIVRVRAVAGEKDLFELEVVQAGTFLIKGFSAAERTALLGTFCPGMLYHYARAAITDIVDKGGFPQLLVQPLNFDAMFEQNMRSARPA